MIVLLFISATAH